MRQTMMERWIETAEARQVCEFVMAEQLVPRPPAAAPLMAKLLATKIADLGLLFAAFAASTRWEA